jgi:hypothetical protein
MILHPEGKEIAALLAPETVEHLLGRAHRERRRFFRVKGAQPHIALAGPLELDKLTDQFDDVHGPLDLFFSRLVTVHEPCLTAPEEALGLKKKKPLHWMKELFSGAFLFDHHVSIS